MTKQYIPPFTITPDILALVEKIGEAFGLLKIHESHINAPMLRRGNRIRTIQGSLAIEGNTLDLEQVTAIVDGKKVVGKKREIQEVTNAIAAYDKLESWKCGSKRSLLDAHKIMMSGLIEKPGCFRTGSVGIQRGKQVVHVAPPAANVPALMNDLLNWTASSKDHPLIKSSVFHYEFEFIHPFADGNGRMGRLWQTVLLCAWRPVCAWLPVESIIRERQKEYYAALTSADTVGNATPFIEFMLEIILDAVLQGAKTDQVSDQVSDQVNKLLNVLISGEADAKSLMERLGLSHRATFRQNYLNPALDKKYIELTNPDSPRSPKQKYRITEKGKLHYCKENNKINNSLRKKEGR